MDPSGTVVARETGTALRLSVLLREFLSVFPRLLESSINRLPERRKALKNPAPDKPIGMLKADPTTINTALPLAAQLPGEPPCRDGNAETGKGDIPLSI